MRYEEFRDICNKVVFGKSKADLLEKLAKYPERYVGIFRPTKPHAKIIQNLTQSNEIRFGDAFEIIIERYLIENGYDVLEKKMDVDGDKLVVDQLVKEGDSFSGDLVEEQVARKKKKVIFIEQKLRDDHDSTKKRGQILNFEKKLSRLLDIYKENEIRGYFYFIDPSLSKNKNYYIVEIEKLSTSYGTSLKLVYGRELFDELKLGEVWEELERHLANWKKDLPELPDINFDMEAEKTFEEIKNLDKSIYRKLFEQEKIIKEFFPVIFPKGKVLKMLKENFQKQEGKIYENLAISIDSILKQA